MADAREYTTFAKALYEETCTLFEIANREYSDDAAWTTNFDTAAHFLRMRHPGVTPRDTALVYLLKSIFSIAKAHTERESMRSRYMDAINYLTFMAWMDTHGHDARMVTNDSKGFTEGESAGSIPSEEVRDISSGVPGDPFFTG